MSDHRDDESVRISAISRARANGTHILTSSRATDGKHPTTSIAIIFFDDRRPDEAFKRIATCDDRRAKEIPIAGLPNRGCRSVAKFTCT
jgi:hypothetical protein